MPTTSAHQLCIEGVHTDVQALVTATTIAGLGITTSRVFKRKLPTDRNLAYAAATSALIVVSYPAGASLSLHSEFNTNQQEAVGYPVQVTGFYAADQNLEIDSDSDTFALWAEKIFRRYHGKNPLSVTGVFKCVVEPGTVIDPDTFQTRNTMAWAHVIRCIGRFARI